MTLEIKRIPQVYLKNHLFILPFISAFWGIDNTLLIVNFGWLWFEFSFIVKKYERKD